MLKLKEFKRMRLSLNIRVPKEVQLLFQRFLDEFNLLGIISVRIPIEFRTFRLVYVGDLSSLGQGITDALLDDSAFNGCDLQNVTEEGF